MKYFAYSIGFFKTNYFNCSIRC